MMLLQKEGVRMKDISELSGNIKLRLPRSLHDALIRQADFENVSLNQLCLMYLSAGVSKGKNLGTYEFNRRLEEIANESKSEEDLFQRLKELSDDVERLKPFLLHELEGALNENKRSMWDYIEVLRSIYPIYHGDIMGERLPMLKLPSAKIVLRPKYKEILDFKLIESTVEEQCVNAFVSYGDYDIYITRERQTIDEMYIKSISIHFECDFSDLRNLVDVVNEKLHSLDCADKMIIMVKPSYNHVATRILLEKK